MPSAPALPRPVRLGPYDLVEPLAKGAMGEVWRGRHRGTGTPVAIKCLLETGSDDDWAETSFANEVRAAAGLSHPGIVGVLDHGVIPPQTAEAAHGRLPVGHPYLVMELLDGRPLHELIGRLDWPLARDLLAQLLAALAHSHARGVIHRDLKPGNILVEPRLDAADRRVGWRLRVTDFGLAQAIDQNNPVHGVVAGTPAYMAPEQLQGDWRGQGPWTDLYSLGCLGWALLAGQPPFGRQREFAAVSLDHLHRPPPVLVPGFAVPEAVEGWLRRLLEKRPADRYASAADAAHALLSLPSEPVLEPPEPDDAGAQQVVMGALPEGHDDETTGAPRAAADPPAVVPEVSTQVLPEDLPPMPAEPWPAPPGHDPLPATRVRTPASWQRADTEPPAPQLLGAGLNLYGLRAVPMVDRLPERDQLWEGLLRVEESGSAHLVVLRGAAGCGKSRLAEWLGQTAHEIAGCAVLRAWHSATEASGTGLVPMIARHLRCTGLTRDQVLERLRALAHDRDILDPDDVVALCELLSPATEQQVEDGAPMVRFGGPRERFALLRRVLERLDRDGRPLVVLIDDAQWGAEALQFADWLLSTQDAIPLPVYLVLTAQEAALVERPDEAIGLEQLCQGDLTRVIELGPLPRDAHAHLVRALLGIDGELVAQVTRRTAGNPLFAVQLIGDWVTRGVLEPGARGFRLKEGEKVHIPDDLHEVWRNRIDRLLDGQGEPEAQALELAAALGDKVNRDEWTALCARTETRADVRRLLGRLLVLRLARVDPDGDGWLFSHPMLRESLTRRAREGGRAAEWHRACANMLEVRHGNLPGAAERIAWHLLESGDDRDALQYLLESAEDRVRKGDLDVAERLLDARLAALTRLDVSLDDPVRADAWFLRLRILRVQGRVDEAEPVIEEAIVSARINGWTAVLSRARLHQGLHLYRKGHFLRAWRRLRQAEELAREAGEEGLVATALLEQGRLLIERGRLGQAQGRLETARDLHANEGLEDDEATCGWLLGRIAKQRGDLAAAMDRFTDALVAFERIGARWGVASCTNELGEVSRLQGDLDAAEIHYRDALSRMEELGADDAHVVRINLAQVLLRRERFGEAEPLLLATLRAFEGSEHRAMVGIAHALLLVCAAAARDWEAWDRHSRAAIDLLTETSWVEHDVALAACQAGDLASDAGHNARAREAWEMARAQWLTLDRPRDVAEMDARLGEAVLA